jgi:hypothetical protein
MERWNRIPGFPGYLASDRGRIRSLKRRKVLARQKNRRGYLALNLYRWGRPTNCLVHRLVWAAFHGPIPENKQIDHINGVKTDARLRNLALVTPEENRRRARVQGLVKSNKGVLNVNAKLTEEDVRSIRALRQQGCSVPELANRFGMSQRAIYAVIKRETWAHVQG